MAFSIEQLTCDLRSREREIVTKWGASEKMKIISKAQDIDVIVKKEDEVNSKSKRKQGKSSSSSLASKTDTVTKKLNVLKLANW